MRIVTTYDMGDMVYLITDVEQLQRIVTTIIIKPNNDTVYDLSCGSQTSSHYEMEISQEKTIF